MSDTKLIVVFGVGGVGKTTSAASLGLSLAQKGFKVAVTTVDPAKRLAQIMGLKELSSQPQPVFQNSIQNSKGSMDALWIDSAHVLEDLIRGHGQLFKDPDSIIQNRLFRILQTQLGGIEEYLGLEKILELKNSGRYDYCILDTPPSRQGLDYLDAPEHLIKFLDEGVLKYFLSSATESTTTSPFSFLSKVLQFGTENVLNLFKKFLGSSFLTELAALLNAISPLRTVFLETAHSSQKWLSSSSTRFLVISSLETYPLEEALLIEKNIRLKYPNTPLSWVLNKSLSQEFRKTIFHSSWLNYYNATQSASLKSFEAHIHKRPDTRVAFIEPFSQKQIRADSLAQMGEEILKSWSIQ